LMDSTVPDGTMYVLVSAAAREVSRRAEPVGGPAAGSPAARDGRGGWL
jgi:hypothetical protein